MCVGDVNGVDANNKTIKTSNGKVTAHKTERWVMTLLLEGLSVFRLEMQLSYL